MDKSQFILDLLSVVIGKSSEEKIAWRKGKVGGDPMLLANPTQDLQLMFVLQGDNIFDQDWLRLSIQKNNQVIGQVVNKRHFPSIAQHPIHASRAEELFKLLKPKLGPSQAANLIDAIKAL